MAGAVVQSAELTAAGSPTYTITLLLVTAGNFLAFCSSEFNSNTTASVSDGTAYTQSFAVSDGGSPGQRTFLDYLENVGAGTHDAVWTPGAGTPDFGGLFMEVSGIATSSSATGTPATNSATSGTTSSTGTTTPAQAAFIIAVDGHGGTGTCTENAGAEGFTLVDEHESGSGAEPYSVVVKPTISSGVSHSWTIPNDIWAAGIAAFKEASTAGPGARAIVLQAIMDTGRRGMIVSGPMRG